MPTSSVTGHWWSAIGQVGSAVVSYVDLSPHPAREAEAFSWLDEQEQARASRFTNAGARRRFILCRAALRALLSHDLGCSNEQLAFGASEHAKPFAIVQGLPALVSFNVSHSGKHGLVALAPEGRLGIDVEECAPYRNVDIIIDAVLTPAEQADLALATGSDRHRAFFKIWTVKEALVKALGTGLTLDASSFEVPPAMRRGANSVIFAFPHAPSDRWLVHGFENKDFVAAIAHELSPASSLTGPDLNARPLTGLAR